MIDFWYGERQRFGFHGRPQRFVNLLGRVSDPARVRAFTCRVDGGAPLKIPLGPDGYRLAAPGDFNVELPYKDLSPGTHRVDFSLESHNGGIRHRSLELEIASPASSPGQIRLDFRNTPEIPDSVQVVDGRWIPTPQGLRIAEPYYDRALGFGDLSCQDAHLRAWVIFHGMTPPDPARDGGADVIHAGLALRWPGHDEDKFRPRRKWYPLGASAEFRLSPGLKHCGWRILGGPGSSVKPPPVSSVCLETLYLLEHRVRTLPPGISRHEARISHAAASLRAEKDWDLVMEKPPGGTKTGGALFLAHYSDLTLCQLELLPLFSESF